MLGLDRLGIQSKLILLLLLVSLSSIGMMAFIGYTSGKNALNRAVENQLKGIQVSKTNTLKAMLGSLKDQVISMSDSQMALEGMRAFKQAYRDLSSKALNTDQEAKLRDFYRNTFLPELARQLDAEPVLEQFIPTSSADRYLQYHYIAANPHPYLRKQDLDSSPTDSSSYAEAHSRLHRYFGRAARLFGYEDLMLVDAETLHVVYSYQKSTDFATSLDSGPYADTHVGSTLRIMRKAKDRDDFKIADFEPYRPNLGKPMGFAMSPIYDGPKMIGILLLQFPIDNFNVVLTGNYNWTEEGLGETGECYVVGPDKLMRSRSRFMHASPGDFLEGLRKSGVNPSVISRIERQGNVMNILPVSSESAILALRGQSGIMRTTDYRGTDVLSAYGPLELDSLRWAVLAEIDSEEALAPVREFGKKVMVFGTGMALAVTMLALVASHALTKPLRALAEGVRKVGAGQTEVVVNLHTRDEFGDLGMAFNAMAASIKEQKDKLQRQISENLELLHGILPASAVVLRQGGDTKANRQFTDVTVLFAEIVGLDDFSAKEGEARAISVLGDLVSAFDEAAEKAGVEKVKTTGGSYLAACGLSVTRPDHCRRVIQFAKEMIRIAWIFNRDHKADLKLSIGINTGPTAGGIVGTRKFLYELWGETVSIARLIARDMSPAIRVTASVRDRLGDEFPFSGPVGVPQEGKPPVEAWQLAN
jgi:class 3 adenylate cyclase